MDIYRFMVYSPQISEFKIRDIRLEGKRTRLDESSKLKFKKRFYDPESFIGKKDRATNKNSVGGGHTFERSRCDI